MSSDSLAAVAAPVPPHGLDQITTTFGDIFAYVGPDHLLDPRWQTDSLERVELAFAMKLSWDTSRMVTQITCHKLLTGIFADMFRRIQSAGLQGQITSFGGCFSFRPQRTGTKLSAHAWGIAIDLNPETNMQGTAGNMDPRVITIFLQCRIRMGRGLAGQNMRSNAFSVLHWILRAAVGRWLLARKFQPQSTAQSGCSEPTTNNQQPVFRPPVQPRKLLICAND